MSQNLLRIFQFSIALLKFLGIWRWNNPTKYREAIVTLMVQSFLVSFTVIQATNFLRARRLGDFVQAMSILVACLGMHMKTLNLMWKLKKIQQTIAALKNLLTLDDWMGKTRDSAFKRRIWRVKEKYSSHLGFVLMSGSTSFWLSYMTNKLPYKMFQIETTSRSSFWYANSYEFAINILAGYIVITLDYLPILFFAFANEMFASLQKLQELADIKSLKRLNAIQLKLRLFVNQIMECFLTVTMIQAGSSAIILCNAAYSLTHVSRSKLSL